MTSKFRSCGGGSVCSQTLRVRVLESFYVHSWLLFFYCVQFLSCFWLFATPWTVAIRGLLSPTISQSLLKFRSIELVMLSNHLILCCPLILLPSVFPSIRVFSNESALQIRWPKYWSFSFSFCPPNECSWFPLGLTCLISLQSKGFSTVFCSTTIRKHQFFGVQPFLWSNYHICTWTLEKP